MDILETGHAYLTAYEALQVVKMRTKAAKAYMDGRDADILGDFKRIQQSRLMLMDTLLRHCPDGTSEHGEDDISGKIVSFTTRVQELIPEISPQQIRNLVAIRPRNQSELASIFSSIKEWKMVATKIEDLISLIEEEFPKQASK